jgi:hypothetical protein
VAFHIRGGGTALGIKCALSLTPPKDRSTPAILAISARAIAVFNRDAHLKLVE